MSHTAYGTSRNQKWYNKNIFPLVPVLEIRKKDKYNTSGFKFRWLFITIWSLDTLKFEFSITTDMHWGLGFTGVLFYMRWVVTIPFTEKFGNWWHKLTNRRVRYRRVRYCKVKY